MLAVTTLGTSGQRRLDARALRLWESADLDDATAAARATYLAAHGPVASEEALARLDGAVSELALGMLMTALNDDPGRPEVLWLGTGAHRWFDRDVPGSRWAFDNPDTIYRTVPIDPESTYELEGRMVGAGTADLAFSLLSDQVLQTTVAYADGHALRRRRQRSYRLTIGPEPARGRRHHLQTTADTVQLFVRTLVADWATQQPDRLSVRRVKGPRPGAPRTDEQVVEETRAVLLKGAPVFGTLLLGARTMTRPVNTLSPAGQTPGALVSQANSFGHFDLTDDQALVVRLDPGGAQYVTLPVTDPWMLSVDPARHPSSLNHRQADSDPDGTFTYVVSPTDPGVANWVSTAGQHEGTIMARWQRLGSGTPAITTDLVDLVDLPDVLPVGTRRVSPAERASTLQARARAFRRRYR